MIRALVLAFAVVAPAALFAEPCRNESYRGNDYTVCRVDAESADLRLFLRDDEDRLFGQFSAVDRHLFSAGEKLVFAMNAGMYHADRSPVGLYVERSSHLKRLVVGASPGNFGLVPNGVFCIRGGRADVIETERFQASAPDCTYATQSGPMLVIDGALHPRFLVDGTSKFIRNGVGTSADGSEAIFAISNNTVNFHAFGLLFRDHLKMPNALYLDGKVSRLYAPSVSRNDLGFALGPIIGLVERLD